MLRRLCSSGYSPPVAEVMKGAHNLTANCKSLINLALLDLLTTVHQIASASLSGMDSTVEFTRSANVEAIYRKETCRAPVID